MEGKEAHAIFALGVSLLAARLLGVPIVSPPTAVGALAAILANILVDIVGHEGYHRSGWSHSILGVTLTTIASYLAVASAAYTLGYLPEPRGLLVALAGGLSHLPLDLTRDGIEPLWPVSRLRLRTPIPSTSPAYNKAVMLAGLALLLAALAR